MLLKINFYCIYQEMITTTLSATYIFDGCLDQYFKRYFSRTLWKVFLFYVKNIQMKNIHVKLWPRRIWISPCTDYGCLVAECVLRMLLQYPKFLSINWFHLLFSKFTNSKQLSSLFPFKKYTQKAGVNGILVYIWPMNQLLKLTKQRNVALHNGSFEFWQIT